MGGGGGISNQLDVPALILIDWFSQKYYFKKCMKTAHTEWVHVCACMCVCMHAYMHACTLHVCVFYIKGKEQGRALVCTLMENLYVCPTWWCIEIRANRITDIIVTEMQKIQNHYSTNQNCRPQTSNWSGDTWPLKTAGRPVELSPPLVCRNSNFHDKCFSQSIP